MPLPRFTPRLVLAAFGSDDPADLDRSERTSLRLLWLLIDHNIEWLLAHPETPPIYASGLRWNAQDYGDGEEDWMDIPTALATCNGPSCPNGGLGTDCKVLVAYRVAELRLAGYDARPWLYRQVRAQRPDGSRVYGYHVVVRLPDGTDEDISRRLGMSPSRVF